MRIYICASDLDFYRFINDFAREANLCVFDTQQCAWLDKIAPDKALYQQTVQLLFLLFGQDSFERLSQFNYPKFTYDAREKFLSEPFCKSTSRWTTKTRFIAARFRVLINLNL